MKNLRFGNIRPVIHTGVQCINSETIATDGTVDSCAEDSPCKSVSLVSRSDRQAHTAGRPAFVCFWNVHLRRDGPGSTFVNSGCRLTSEITKPPPIYQIKNYSISIQAYQQNQP